VTAVSNGSSHYGLTAETADEPHTPKRSPLAGEGAERPERSEGREAGEGPFTLDLIGSHKSTPHPAARCARVHPLPQGERVSDSRLGEQLDAKKASR
jgi:hypothetical protein